MHQLMNEWGRAMGYTRTLVHFTANVEQRDGYAPDAVVEVELVTCDLCGAVVLSGDTTLETVSTHEEWHDRLSGQNPDDT